MNSYEMLKDTLIKNFSYHDGKIIEFKKDGFDYILKFRDGWVDEQINEIRFVTARVRHQFDLSDREIYQLGRLGFVEKGPGKYIYMFEIYVWHESNLLEPVGVEAGNIILKEYIDGKLVKEENLADALFNN